MALIPAEVAAFVTGASLLPLAALDEIRDATARAVASGEYGPAAAPEFDAARFATCQKAVRDAFHPRAGELRAGRPGGLRAAIGGTTTTAQAIWKRDGLGAADYALLTGAFLTHGVGVPARTPG
ncbi:hypothetical protein [Streptomyces roseolus]|uniref:hypothetical protein n=1 Tax=Streptomyces roseolus TaxID=67358 RepID=UPI00364F3198